MEIVKQNETYKITDSVNGWEMEGQASKDISGQLNINFQVTVPGELAENLGDCSYSQASEHERASVSFSVAESNRDKFTAYMDTVIDTVHQHFSNIM